MTNRTRSRLAIALCSLLAACALWYPAFLSPFATGFGDWQFFHHMWEAGYVALTRYGEWPLWDPYHCGGITIFGNPQSQHLSPFYLLALLAGPTLGSKLFLLAHAWAGFAGAYVLARREGLAVPGSLLASLAWAASGFFVSHGSGGHSAFLPFYLTPWLLLAWRAAARDPRHVLGVVALLVLVLLEGGVYPFPYLLLLLAFDALLRAFVRDGAHARESLRGIVAAGVATAVLVALCGAVRIVPIVDELRRSPRTMPSVDGVSFRELLEMLTARSHGWRYAGHPFVWPEYVSYVGWGSLGLAAIGCVVAGLHRRRLVLALLVFMALTMGDHGVLSLWSLVHRLPIYDSLRVPSRFAVFFTLQLALLAGLGLDACVALLARRLPRRWALGIAYAACLVIAGDLAWVHFPTLDRWTNKPIVSDSVSPRFYLSPLPYGAFYASFPRMNLGSRGCYEAMTFSPAPGLRVGDKPQARFVEGQGELLDFTRSTRRVRLQVQLVQPGRLLVNQNFAPGWRSDVGRTLEYEGKLAVDLPAGARNVTLTYTPVTLGSACVLSAIGLLLSLSFAWAASRGTFAKAWSRAASV